MQLNQHFTLDTINKTLVVHKIPDMDVLEIPYKINGRRYNHVCFDPVFKIESIQKFRFDDNVRTISFLNRNEKINNFETIAWPSELIDIRISNTYQSISELVTLSNSKVVPKVLIEPVFEWDFEKDNWQSTHTAYRFPKKTINNNLVVISVFN